MMGGCTSAFCRLHDSGGSAGAVVQRVRTERATQQDDASVKINETIGRGKGPARTQRLGAAERRMTRGRKWMQHQLGR